ncbi:uncharacterized protein LOC126210381 isoform X1 [Schistocerca nitens]|uniref:uncharacterized protein LOC126210381 isoform X1 n=1 Tax=Schistocerca nitens TaxID=7011 RepID=UPI0021184E0C|nr:uncharacterized protein LOC126210381 isoform X1 [Schistocerca nitens]
MHPVGVAASLLALLAANGTPSLDCVCLPVRSSFEEYGGWSTYCKQFNEEWQMEDSSNATLSVDTGCMQLLANALDHPTCSLEDLPPETIKRREQCRVQLWRDLSQGSPHIPVTSYLANVNLCLFAWMTVNSISICQDDPISTIQSVRDARRIFDSRDDLSCPESNAADAIRSAS